MRNMNQIRLGQQAATVGKKIFADYRIPLLAILLFFFMGFAESMEWARPNFQSSYNLYSMADSAAAWGIAAIGFTFILLVGQLDISFGSVISLTSCVFMIMLKNGNDFWLALVVAILLGAACGAFTGFFVANFRLSPFIVTMTMQLIYRGIALAITDSTPVSMSHPVLREINACRYIDKVIPLTFIVFIGLALLAEFILRRTQYGRNLYLVGGNINTADNLGMKSNLYVWSAFILQGVFAAIAGVALMTRQFSASGNTGSQALLNVIPMVIVGGTSMAGGKGNMFKTIFGVVLLSMVYNAMTFFTIPAPMQPFVKGLILCVVVVMDKYMERRHEKV